MRQEAVANVVGRWIGEAESVDVTEALDPTAGLRERETQVPATAFAGSPKETDDDAERRKEPRAVVESLAGERFGAVLLRRDAAGVRDAGHRLHETVEAASIAPGSAMPVGRKRHVDDAGPEIGDLFGTEAEC